MKQQREFKTDFERDRDKKKSDRDKETGKDRL